MGEELAKGIVKAALLLENEPKTEREFVEVFARPSTKEYLILSLKKFSCRLDLIHYLHNQGYVRGKIEKEFENIPCILPPSKHQISGEEIIFHGIYGRDKQG